MAAAFVHAAWNLLLAREEDSRAATGTALLVGVVLLAPFSLAFWDVSWEAVPWAAASAVLELAYLLLLSRAYDTDELSVVYPVSRGAAPVIVLLVTAVVAGVSTVAAAGVLLVAAGILLVRGPSGSARGVLMGLAIAATIAGYTLSDAEGLHHAAAVPYLLLTLGPAALLMRPRGRVSWRVAVAGIGMVGGYLLVLAALELASREEVPAVAALRETSVVIAVVLSAVVLGERVTRGRLAGAVTVVAGVALIGM